MDDLQNRWSSGHHERLKSRSRTSSFHTQIHEAVFDAKKTLTYTVSGPRIYEPIMTENASEAQKEYSQTCSTQVVIKISMNIL